MDKGYSLLRSYETDEARLDALVLAVIIWNSGPKLSYSGAAPASGQNRSHAFRRHIRFTFR